MKARVGYIVLLGVMMLAMVQPLSAQEGGPWHIVAVDTADFPRVRLYLKTADPRATFPNDETALALQENETPITDLVVNTVPVGRDFLFVIDANDTIYQVDDSSGLSRLAKVQASLIRFAVQFMNPHGLDRVTIVVPDEAGENGRFLIQDATTPQAVIEAIEGYNPELPEVGARLGDRATPLNEMLTLALEQAAQRPAENGRFQSLLLFTDGARLDRQLDFTALVEQAQALELPLFAAILGARADPDEIENVNRLVEPTGAQFVHMPRAEATDPIYQVWLPQGNQVEVQYLSPHTASGRYTVNVNLDGVDVSTAYELQLMPPTIVFQPGLAVIRRVGDAPDSRLASLAPQRQTVPLLIRWPDGYPRSLTAVTWTVNGQSQPAPTSLAYEPDGALLLEWDLRALDAGRYTLQAQVMDEWGFSAETEPLPVTISVERPAPMPTPLPTIPLTTAETGLDNQQNRLLLLLAVTGFSAVILLLLGWLQRRRLAQAAKQATGEQRTGELEPTKAGIPLLRAALEVLQDGAAETAVIPLDSDNVTIGRDPAAAHIIFDDKGISRLHARIRRRDGRYWLYDEGSAGGTYLNFERLGLAPHSLYDRDEIQIGRVRLRFRMMTADNPETIVEPPDDSELAGEM